MTEVTKNHSRKHSVKAVLNAEVIKGRRMAARKIAIIAPLPFCILGMLAGGILGGGAVGGFSTVGWNYWYVLMLPIVIALISASIANIDVRQKLHTILGLPLPPAKTWWAKTIYALLLVLVSNIVVLGASTLTGLFGGAAPTFFAGLAIVAVLVIGTAWMIPAGLFLTTRFGTLAGITIPAIVQLGLGIVLWPTRLWFLFPPATTLWAASPFTGVAPSGVPFVEGSPLGVFGWETMLGLLIALVCFVLMAVCGARWFSKREAI